MPVLDETVERIIALANANDPAPLFLSEARQWPRPRNLNGAFQMVAATAMVKKPEPPTPASWDVYKIAKKAVWLGAIDAPDKQTAVERAAREFKTEVWRLYAVARR